MYALKWNMHTSKWKLCTQMKLLPNSAYSSLILISPLYFSPLSLSFYTLRPSTDTSSCVSGWVRLLWWTQTVSCAFEVEQKFNIIFSLCTQVPGLQLAILCILGCTTYTLLHIWLALLHCHTHNDDTHEYNPRGCKGHSPFNLQPRIHSYAAFPSVRNWMGFWICSGQ